MLGTTDDGGELEERLELTRVSGFRSCLEIRAVAPEGSGLDGHAGVAQLHFRPVEEVPDTAVVDIVLPPADGP